MVRSVICFDIFFRSKFNQGHLTLSSYGDEHCVVHTFLLMLGRPGKLVSHLHILSVCPKPIFYSVLTCLRPKMREKHFFAMSHAGSTVLYGGVVIFSARRLSHRRKISDN